MKLETNSCYIKHKEKRICQGDIFEDIIYYILTERKKGESIFDEITVPYLVILSQECDLEQDFKNHIEKTEKEKPKEHDKYLQSILVTPAYHAEKLHKGTHLEGILIEGIPLKMQQINSKIWPNIVKNQHPRYHYLEPEIQYNIPKLVIDFKHYYTIPRDYFYKNFKKKYIGTLDQLFRESLSIRFSNYLSRIGLPIINKN